MVSETKDKEAKMTKYENKTLNKATFVLEDCYFLNCVLTECDLFYSGGDVEAVGTRFENCHMHFRGPALKTVQMLQATGMLKVGPLPLPSKVEISKVN